MAALPPQKKNAAVSAPSLLPLPQRGRVMWCRFAAFTFIRSSRCLDLLQFSGILRAVVFLWEEMCVN